MWFPCHSSISFNSKSGDFLGPQDVHTIYIEVLVSPIPISSYQVSLHLLSTDFNFPLMGQRCRLLSPICSTLVACFIWPVMPCRLSSVVRLEFHVFFRAWRYQNVSNRDYPLKYACLQSLSCDRFSPSLIYIFYRQCCCVRVCQTLFPHLALLCMWFVRRILILEAELLREV